MIGLIYFNEIKYDDLAWVFVKNGIEAEIINSGVSVDSTSCEDTASLSKILKEKKILAAISMDFCPALSDACMSNGIKYLSWVFDSPQEALFHRQITNNCNYIFSFDKNQVKEIKDLGAVNTYHLPLATNAIRNSGLVISDADTYKYGCDVSFVGNMYVDDYYSSIYQKASDGLKNEMTSIMESAYGKWDGKDRISGRLSQEALNELAVLCNVGQNGDYSMSLDKRFMARLFSRELANKERVHVASSLSGLDFRLYTGSKVVLEGVDIWPPLSYDEELPKAYHLSKINLNITLHSIISGLPLRVFDIMGVGGFMLTNYQPEIDELFSVGEEIEVYKSLDEIKEKVCFYLLHDDIRQRIALKGYQKVSEKYNNEEAVKKMFMKAKIS